MGSISYDKKRNKYIARAMIDGKRTYLGQFDTRDDAEFVLLKSTPSALSKAEVEYVDVRSSVWIRALSRFFSIDKNVKAAQKHHKNIE